MPILTRIGALGVLTLLAACDNGTIAVVNGEPVDSNEVLALAATFTPTHEGDGVSAMEAAESEGGLSGLVGLEDGTIVPVKVQIDREANTLSITYGDDDPIVLERSGDYYGNEEWSSDTLTVRSYGNSSYFYFYDTDDYEGVELDLFTAPEDLPTSGQVGYNGWFNMQGAETRAGGNLALAVDFETSAVTGSILGGLSDGGECCFREEGPESEGPSGDSFFGSLDGTISDGLLGASGTVTGTVDGDVSLLGGFTDQGNGISGAIAGTIDDQTMGGEFDAWSGGYYD